MTGLPRTALLTALALALGLAACSATRGPGATRDFGFEQSDFKVTENQTKTLTKAERDAEIARLQSLGRSHVKQTEQDIQRAGR